MDWITFAFHDEYFRPTPDILTPDKVSKVKLFYTRIFARKIGTFNWLNLTAAVKCRLKSFEGIDTIDIFFIVRTFNLNVLIDLLKV